MGQAKNRGTREERVALAVAEKQKAKEKAEREAQQRWDSMTPEERKEAIERQTSLAMIMGLASQAYGGPLP